MEYVAFIGTEGPSPEESLQVMRRELPGWVARANGRGRLFGRELKLPDESATVRVRAGETLVTDGPFAETKEFVAGFDLLRCADLDEAIEVMSESPVAWFHPVELRPFRGGLLLGPHAAAFGKRDDAAGTPFLLVAWVGEAPEAELDEEVGAWRQDLADRYVLGGALAGPEAATTMRVQGERGEVRLADGPFVDPEAFMAALDIVHCAGLEQAVELADTHPLARDGAIEVRTYYVNE
jgi:hypothetical protein